MFIALDANSCALQRSAMCFGPFRLHSAPDGAGMNGRLRAINMVLLRSKTHRPVKMSFHANPGQTDRP